MNVLQSGVDGEIVHATSARTKLEETENEIRKTILDYFTDIRNGRGITCSDPASCTGKCVWTGDHADRIVNSYYQIRSGKISS